MKRRRNICIKIIVAKGEEAQGKTGVLRLPVKFLLGGSETGVELHVSCVSDCAGGGWHGDGFVCVYQNTHLIIPRIAVGAESGYAAARLFRA